VIAALCAQAVTPAGPVAAVCVYGRFAAQAVEALRDTPVRVATVANFPHGGDDAGPVVEEARRAVAAGVDEVDVVLPYARYAAGDTAAALAVVEATREATSGVGLKVILETGQLGDPELVRRAAADALAAGADFVKTSTGKTSPGATTAAARPMLEAVRDAGHGGFKASGGIRTTADAGEYLALADEILGAGWATPATMRFGASSLLDDLLEALGAAGGARSGGEGGY
jgi:deoxyribose-phosphate aldolase